MLYQTYQFQDDLLAPLRDLAQFMNSGLQSFSPLPANHPFRRFAAAWELISRYKLSHERPDFAIDTVRVGNRDVPVTEDVALDLPFGKLLKFSKDVDARQPRVLVVAPLSGHFATLLRGTVATLLEDHEVYITDWTNARDVPLEAGSFGVEDYVEYIIRFLEEIGPGAHILAVCQPCVQALVAVAVMSEDKHPATPHSMTLMAGPIDPRESPTEVNEFAVSKSLSWFQTSVISTVPARYPGGGRAVYPGFLQLFAFMAMNIDRHRSAHRKLYDHLAAGETEAAEKIKTFYDEYFAVLDMTEEFYIETIDGFSTRRNSPPATSPIAAARSIQAPSATRRSSPWKAGATISVRSARPPPPTISATRLRPHLKRHHLQANVGHYGVFNGKRWEREIYPVVRNMILATD
jgi:poly(3-hydroxybutyrate) depolymerase